MTAFAPLLELLAEIPDPRRAEGKLYKLPHVLLFSILAVVTGSNSYRGIVTFITVHRRRLNAAFGLKWRRAPPTPPSATSCQGLESGGGGGGVTAMPPCCRQPAAAVDRAALPWMARRCAAASTLFVDRAAAQVLSAFATDTALVLAHVDIKEKSNEIPAAQKLLAELGIAPGALVTLDALHCQKKSSRSPAPQTSP